MVGQPPRPQPTPEETRKGCLMLVGLLALVAIFIFAPDDDPSSDSGESSSDSGGEESSLSSADSSFLLSLSGRSDYEGYSDQSLINIGREVCSHLDDGGTWSTLAIVFDEEGWSSTQGGYLAGAAVGAYCPEHESAIR